MIKYLRYLYIFLLCFCAAFSAEAFTRSGGGQAPQYTIGGTAIGTASVSGVTNGYTLVGGDNYTHPLNIMGEGVTGGEYAPCGASAAQCRIRGSPNNQRYNGDPLHTGWTDSHRGTPVGFSDIMVQNSSGLTLKSRVSTAGEQTYSDTNNTYIFASDWSTPYLTVTAPAVIVWKATYPSGMPAGVHPTLWVWSTSPANNANAGLEFDACEGSSQYCSYGCNVHGTVSGWTSSNCNSTYSLQSLNLYGSSAHIYSLLLNSSGASLYVDGSLAHTYSGDTTAPGVPYQILFTNVLYNTSWNGDSGINASEWTSAGAAGAQVTLAYYQVWIPTTVAATQVFTPAINLPTAQVAYNGSVNYTFPSCSSIYTGTAPDSCYYQAYPFETFEPGGSTGQGSPYTQFPAGLTLSGTSLTGSLSTAAAGRLNLIAIPTKSGGSLNQTAQGYIDFGPNITTSSISYSNGTGSYDVYPITNVGTLVPKVVAVTGLPSGLTFSPSTCLITGTATTGSYTISISVTNSSGQNATNSSVTLTVGS